VAGGVDRGCLEDAVSYASLGAAFKFHGRFEDGHVSVKIIFIATLLGGDKACIRVVLSCHRRFSEICPLLFLDVQ
jgi:hypothetical protein